MHCMTYQGIGLRGYASKNPKLEFRRESFGLFEELLQNIRLEATRFLSRVEIEVNDSEELKKTRTGDRRKTYENQELESAFDSSKTQKSQEEKISEKSEQGNRRLRRYEAKMARKKGKKN